MFITGRRQDALDEAVKQIGRNVTGVQGDASNLDDLDRLFDTVKREKGSIDVLFASAGFGGDAQKLGEITEKNFDALFGLNTRGTLFTVPKALPLSTRDQGFELPHRFGVEHLLLNRCGDLPRAQPRSP